MKTKTITREHYDALHFSQCPQDAGQIVSVTYACDEYGLYERVYDRSDRTESITYREYDRRCGERRLACEPWNGVLPQCAGQRYAVEVDSSRGWRERERLAALADSDVLA